MITPFLIVLPGFLPVLFCLTVFLLITRPPLALGIRSFRDAVLVAVAITAAWLVLGTELLSLLHALSYWPLAWWWFTPMVGGLLMLARGLPLRWPLRLFRWRAAKHPLLWISVLLLLWTWLEAVFSPPTVPDCLAYHLPRQVYWSQQASVEHFATSILRQVTMPPFTEFVGLHLLVLTGNDRLHNLVQWTALVLLVLVLTRIVQWYGGSRQAQLLAGVLTVTIPMAFIEAPTPKNDVVVAFWLCLAAYLTLRIKHPLGRRGWLHCLVMGCCFGGLVLTKGTGVIFGIPVGLLAAWQWVRFYRKRAWLPALAVLALSLGLNTGHFWRNYQAFGSLTGPDAETHKYGVLSQLHTPAALGSTMVRNIVPHFATPSAELNGWLTRAVMRLHTWLGLDVNDPRTTYLLGGFSGVCYLPEVECAAGSPAHMLLLLALPLLLALAGNSSRVRRTGTVALMGLTAAGFFLFCLLLKWQVFHVRLVIGLTCLLVPVWALALTAPRLRRLMPVAVALLLLALLPSLDLASRPLLGPRSIFLHSRETLRTYGLESVMESQIPIANTVAEMNAQSVGLLTDWSSWDYGLLRMILDRMPNRPPRFVAFNGLFRSTATPEPDPDLLVCEKRGPLRVQHLSTGSWYAAVGQVPDYTLMRQENGLPDVSKVTLMVVGTLGAFEARADGKSGTSAIRVSEVLKGPPALTQVSLFVVGPALLPRAAITPTRFPPGYCGIWLLTPGPAPGTYSAVDAAYVRPLSEREALLAALRNVAQPKETRLGYEKGEVPFGSAE